MTAPVRRPTKRTVDGMTFLLVMLALFIGAAIGFLIAAVLATSAHDEECARCWRRTMQNIRPKDYEEHSCR